MSARVSHQQLLHELSCVPSSSLSPPASKGSMRRRKSVSLGEQHYQPAMLGVRGGREMARGQLDTKATYRCEGNRRYPPPSAWNVLLGLAIITGTCPATQSKLFVLHLGQDGADNPVPLRTDMWQRPESNLPYGTARWFYHQEHKSWGPRDRQKGKGLPTTQPMTPPASQPATRPSVCPSKRNMLPFLSPSPFLASHVAPSGN